MRGSLLLGLALCFGQGCSCGVELPLGDAGSKDAGKPDGGGLDAGEDAGTLPGLTSVWAAGSHDVWAVGDRGTATHWDGGRWATAPSFTEARLNRVRGTASNDVWAVGADAGSGVAFHWDGTGWTAKPPPAGPPLLDVWGSSATDVYAVGAAGTLWHWAGTSWAKQSAAGTVTDLFGVWGPGPSNDVWLIGNSGAVVRWNGNVWAAGASPLQTDLRQIWGADATHVWVVSNFGGIFFWNGSTWATERADTILQDVYDLFGVDAANVWTLEPGLLGGCTLRKRDQGTWTVATGPGHCGALGGTSPTDLWVVGARISHWDGVSWTPSAR